MIYRRKPEASPVPPIAWSENQIASALALQTFKGRAIVLVPNCGWTGAECDLLVVDTSLRIIDVEIKISRSDLKADAKKEKWWRRKFTGYGPEEKTQYGSYRPAQYDSTPLEWPRKVWKHYYAVPAEIWDDKLLQFLPSTASGVIALTHTGAGKLDATVVRRATPCRDAETLTPAQVVAVARLANLRYWDVRENLDRTRMLLDEQRNQQAATA